ncbi:MAG: 50S ribosomal protein L9 [Planctomycetia bacterium]|nr:50S ribosomal protein L9 [Planctomycetia bacterium]
MQVRNKRARNAYRTGKRLPKGPNGGIQLMLIQTIPSLGKAGDIVEVKPGYARNYLIPQGLAAIATNEVREQLAAYQAEQAKLRQQKIEDLQKLAAQIKGVQLQIEAKAHQEASPDNPEATVYYLYGSIGPKEIVDALAAQSIKIDVENVRMPGAIKEANAAYEIDINLGHDVLTTLQLSVIAQA